MDGVLKKILPVVLIVIMWLVLFLIEWSIEGENIFDPGSCAICGRSNPEDYAATIDGEDWCYMCVSRYCHECKSYAEKLYGGRCRQCLANK